jgi:glycosyltransferase involved in cell wall biosynthesis
MLVARTQRQKRDIKKARIVIALSRCFAEQMSHDYGVPRERFRTLPIPIDLQRYSPRPELSTAGSASRKLTILYVSRISVRKGVEMVVRLSHALADLEGLLRIDVVGGHSLWSDYRPLLSNLNPQIGHYRGPLAPETLADVYRDADIVIQPSHYEPFGLTVAEGLATGVPVVASDQVGAAEGVDQSCCRTFEAGDFAAFEQRVRELVQLREEESAEVRRRAREEAERLFSPRQVTETLAQYLHEAAALSK